MEWRLYLRSKLLRILKPFSYVSGKISWPFHPKITLEIANKIVSYTLPGDVILLSKRGHLTNLLIPGKYNHAAIVSSESFTVDAVDPAVRILFSYELFSQYDHCVVLRPNFLSVNERYRAGGIAIQSVGIPYDFSFEDSSGAFYCSELVTFCLRKAWGRKEPCPWQHRDIFGMITTVPQDFYESSKFSKIYEI